VDVVGAVGTVAEPLSHAQKAHPIAIAERIFLIMVTPKKGIVLKYLFSKSI
jgi:hypothetical protein